MNRMQAAKKSYNILKTIVARYDGLAKIVGLGGVVGVIVAMAVVVTAVVYTRDGPIPVPSEMGD